MKASTLIVRPVVVAWIERTYTRDGDARDTAEARTYRDRAVAERARDRIRKAHDPLITVVEEWDRTVGSDAEIDAIERATEMIALGRLQEAADRLTKLSDELHVWARGGA